MAASGWLRRARRQFGISAPRMAVRTQIPWWGAAAAAALIAAVTAGLWWWGYDVRDTVGGFDRRAVVTRMTTLETDIAARDVEVAALRARNSVLESELAIARGAHDALLRQASELSAQNGELKERTAFLEQLVRGTHGPPGVPTAALRR